MTEQLARIGSELMSISALITKDLEEGIKLNDIVISNDGLIIAAVGGNSNGYVLVANADSGQLQWKPHIQDCNELNRIVIPPDGKMVYASEPGRGVYVFDVSSQKITNRLEIDKHKTPKNNPQTISYITLSCDGHFLAAVSSPQSQV